ncbi:MAG: MBL fold metallo-hydrolase, partial [Acidobacteria bacterium]|nr:MBL fold metallo-hydrolase [Acidobacteriota bacterium]
QGQEFEGLKWGQNSMSGTGTVKITPLGSHAGEFCRNDRAMLFEDPTGVRILWDPGRTVDETDPRLGVVHVVMLSSTHTDHLGDTKPNPSSPGTCAAPGTISAAPHPNAVAIAASKNAAIFAGGEMTDFIGRKVQNYRGAATPSCAAAGPNNELVVPLSSPCAGSLRPGGSRTVRLNGASTGVRIANFQAFHSNGIPAGFIDSPGVAPGTTGYGGNDGGGIIRFTNGLTVYLTADTGLTGDMDTIVRRFYEAQLVVMNVGDVFSLGPEEAAFAINSLLKPRSVIPSHINEAATSGGLTTGDRLKRFSQMVDRHGADVVIPLSGLVREFDSRGRCVNCGGK